MCFRLFGLFIFFFSFSLVKTFAQQPTYWQNEPIVLDFSVDATSETAPINPFTDYRLQVDFTLGSTSFSVPGYYAADGNAAQTSATTGGVYRVKFVPSSPGEWQYRVSFKQGKDIAISADAYSGDPIRPHDGKVAKLQVQPASENGGFFTTRGRLMHHSSGYFHTQDGQPILKFGANSPENFLAYADIDGTYSYDSEKKFLKQWQAHVNDWREGDPTWQNGKGKGIIGALNYLASEKMNAIYALSLNIEGDAKDVWPFLSHERKDFLRYDVSKLAQWDLIFSHAEKLGIIIQLVTQEKENELLLDNGDTAQERKLYYRELVARFGYHKNIIWNMGEENGSAPWWPQGQSDQQRFAMIRYLKDIDPYNNPIVIHTLPEEGQRAPILDKLIGFDRLDGISMQVSNITDIHEDVKKWIATSQKSERPWVVSMDEIGPWHTGTPDDANNTRLDSLRTEVLWSTLTAGGAGVEWYFGWLRPPNDLNAEDWRSRSKVWQQTAIAKDFFETLPYTEMVNLDDKLKGSPAYCFGREGDVYLIYIKNGGKVSLDLTGFQSDYEVHWFDPRLGGKLQKGSVRRLAGGSWSDIGNPPSKKNVDWAVLLKKVSD